MVIVKSSCPFLFRWKPAPETDLSISIFESLSYLSQQIRIRLSLALPWLFKNYVSHDNDWSDLPTELLEMIFNRRTSIGDLIRVSAVCKSWQLVANSIKQQQTGPAGPFLVLRPPTTTTTTNNDHTEEVHYIYDFSNNKIEKILLLKNGVKKIINSWNEWLVTLNDGSPNYYDHLCFLNLFSKAQVKLPTTTETAFRRRLWFHKVNVSSTPMDPNCVFMAICAYDKKLAFFKQGEKDWKILSESGEDRYSDIVYFKGNFYAVAEGGNLVVCDIDGPEPKVVNVAPSIPEELAKKCYLVESSSDLFQVIKLDFVNYHVRTDNYYQVYKLNLTEQIWQRVYSLGDNSALFVEHNVSMSISAKDFPVKEDCIFFTHFLLGCNKSESWYRDITGFNLKTCYEATIRITF